MTTKSIIKKISFTLLITILLAALTVIALIAIALIQANYRQSEDRVSSCPKTGYFVKAYDTQIFVQRVGSDDAPAVIFIHGTGAWSEIWRPYMNQVAAMGYQAIAIDLPPFGYSVPPASGNYDKASQAKRILAVLDSLGLKQATFVSHSIGSSPLMEALLTQPQRVTKLVMISPALGLQSALSDGSDSFLQGLFRHRWITESFAASVFTNPLFTKSLVKNFVSEKDKVTDAWVDIYRKPFNLSGSYQAVALWLPELMAGRSSLKSDTPEKYQSISFPVKLIWGKDDQVTPISQGVYLQGLIPESKLITIAGGHVPMIEEPKAFGLALEVALKDK